jgi:hypothetical protein
MILSVSLDPLSGSPRGKAARLLLLSNFRFSIVFNFGLSTCRNISYQNAGKTDGGDQQRSLQRVYSHSPLLRPFYFEIYICQRGFAVKWGRERR